MNGRPEDEDPWFRHILFEMSTTFSSELCPIPGTHAMPILTHRKGRKALCYLTDKETRKIQISLQ